MSFFNQLVTNIQKGLGFRTETAKLDFATQVLHEMERQNISKKELAEKMDVSPAMMTRIVKGNHNMTIETMAKVAFALDKKLQFELKGFDEKPRTQKWSTASLPCVVTAANEERFAHEC